MRASQRCDATNPKASARQALPRLVPISGLEHCNCMERLAVDFIWPPLLRMGVHWHISAHRKRVVVVLWLRHLNVGSIHGWLTTSSNDARAFGSAGNMRRKRSLQHSRNKTGIWVEEMVGGGERYETQQ